MNRKLVMGDKNHFKARCAELEDILDLCLKSLNLIPVGQLQQGYQWFPSDEALRIMQRAKDAAYHYVAEHYPEGRS